MPQGSILHPLLFNIDLVKLLYESEESNTASCADDTTPYDTQTLISKCEFMFNKHFHWAQYHHLNPIQDVRMCLFRVTRGRDLGRGEAKSPPSLKSVTHNVCSNHDYLFFEAIKIIIFPILGIFKI